MPQVQNYDGENELIRVKREVHNFRISITNVQQSYERFGNEVPSQKSKSEYMMVKEALDMAFAAIDQYSRLLA